MVEQKDILRVLQNGFVMGKKLLLIVFIPCLFFCQVSWADKDKHPVPLFELKDVSWRETIYIIKIYPDGKVHYHGNYTAVIGDRYAQLTKKQLNELVIYFLSLPFEFPKTYEEKRGNESGTGIIDYKDVYATMHINDPVLFSVFAKKLDKLINIYQWVCFPRESPKYDKSCLRYDLPDDIESFK